MRGSQRVSEALTSISLHRRGRERLDMPLFVGLVALGFIGAMVIYSATREQLLIAGYNPHYYLERQLGFVLGGLLGPIGIGVLLWRGRADLIIPEGTNQTGSQGSDEDHRPGPAPTGLRF